MKLKKRKMKRTKIPIKIRKKGDPVPEKVVYKHINGVRLIFDVSCLKHVRELAAQHPGVDYCDVYICLNGEEFKFEYKEFKKILQKAKRARNSKVE